MRYLGIDYGTKRIGLALSDEEGTLAFPHAVLPNQAGIVQAIEDVVRNEDVEAFVMGESTDLKGEANPVQKQIVGFANALERRFELPIFFEKEFMTSTEAHGRQGKESLHARQTGFVKPTELDARAAALILQRFLDKQKKKDTI